MTQAPIENNEKVDRTLLLARQRAHQFLHLRSGRRRFEKRCRIFAQFGRERERPGFRVRVEEEVERVRWRDLSLEIDRQ